MKYLKTFDESVMSMLTSEPDDFNFSNKELDYWKWYANDYIPGTAKLSKKTILGANTKERLYGIVKYLAKEYNNFEDNTREVREEAILKAIALGKALIDRDGFAPTAALDALLAQEG